MSDTEKRTCPECGAELKPGAECEVCGARKREVEVQLKKFKISEVLDIRVRPSREKKK